jgi:hypothetical protein
MPLIKRITAFCTEKMMMIGSFFILCLALSGEALMHVLSIPHLEGWWLPIVSGSTALTGMLAWFRKKRNKQEG